MPASSKTLRAMALLACGYACGCSSQSAGGECGKDLQADPQNCGACAHACLGGTCASGRCQPVSLASNLERPRGLAVRAGFVYFVTSGIEAPDRGGVFRVPVRGGAAERLSGIEADRLGQPVDVAVDETHAYVARTQPDAIEKVAMTGGASSLMWRSASSTTEGAPYAITLGGTDVLAALRSGNAVIVSVPRSGGAAKGLAKDSPAFQAGLFGIAANATHVFWSSRDKLLRVAKGGGAAEPIAAAEATGDPRGVVLDGGNLFWTDWRSVDPSPNGVVLSCATDCASPTVVAENLRGPLAIAADAKSLYVAVVGLDATSGSIVKIPREGGKPVVLAEGQATPIAIAVDDDAVYWTNGAFASPRAIGATAPAAPVGHVMMIAK